MHCVDCHFKQDNHGNGKLYGEPRNARRDRVRRLPRHRRRDAPTATIGRRLDDAHDRSGGAGRRRHQPADAATRRSDRPRFEVDARHAASIQRSMIDEDLQWGVPQVDGLDHARQPQLQREGAGSRKTMQRDGKTWGDGASPNARARRRADDLHHLPLVVDHELLRLPPVADGQPEAADAAQRGRRRRATGRRTTSRCCATTSTCSARTAR